MKTIDEIRNAFLRIHHVAIGTSERSYMSIPADRERDADLILSDAIDELRRLRETADGEASRTAAAVAAATEKLRSAEQEWVDAVCHYRNLAIGLGAKPETMLNDFDRKLAQDGVSLTERTPGYWSMADSLEELAAHWRNVDVLTAERDALRAQVERMRKVALDASIGDDVAEDVLDVLEGEP